MDQETRDYLKTLTRAQLTDLVMRFKMQHEDGIRGTEASKNIIGILVAISLEALHR